MDRPHCPRLWLAVAVAALLAMAAVALVPAVLPFATSQSPLPPPADVDAAPRTADATPSVLAKIGLTLLWIAVGAAAGTGVLLISVAWQRRNPK
jgi:hypothetical protein